MALTFQVWNLRPVRLIVRFSHILPERGSRRCGFTRLCHELQVRRAEFTRGWRQGRGWRQCHRCWRSAWDLRCPGHVFHHVSGHACNSFNKSSKKAVCTSHNCAASSQLSRILATIASQSAAALSGYMSAIVLSPPGSSSWYRLNLATMAERCCSM
jgi:hypothetical protein